MIFTSIALLVVAAIALGIGIASSSVPPLVVSIVATLAAAGTLWASFVHYRQQASAAGANVTGLGGNTARVPGYPDVYAPGVSGPSPASASASAAPPGWDELPAAAAAELVEAHNLDELHELRRHEVEHRHRSEVLQAIDARIDRLAELRRRMHDDQVTA